MTTGFCAYCQKETERRERCGMIETWVCSVSCATQLEQRFQRPHVPHYDASRNPDIGVVLRFINWCNDNGISLCRFQTTATSADWRVINESYKELMGSYFGFDVDTANKEEALLNQHKRRYEMMVAATQRR